MTVSPKTTNLLIYDSFCPTGSDHLKFLQTLHGFDNFRDIRVNINPRYEVLLSPFSMYVHQNITVPSICFNPRDTRQKPIKCEWYAVSDRVLQNLEKFYKDFQLSLVEIDINKFTYLNSRFSLAGEPSKFAIFLNLEDLDDAELEYYGFLQLISGDFNNLQNKL